MPEWSLLPKIGNKFKLYRFDLHQKTSKELDFLSVLIYQKHYQQIVLELFKCRDNIFEMLATVLTFYSSQHLLTFYWQHKSWDNSRAGFQKISLVAMGISVAGALKTLIKSDNTLSFRTALQIQYRYSFCNQRPFWWKKTPHTFQVWSGLWLDTNKTKSLKSRERVS